MDPRVDDLGSDDDLSSDPPETTNQPEPTREQVDKQCGECDGNVSGLRYKCMQCVDFELCCGCDAAGAHAQHYMLRIPASRPKSEVTAVVTQVRGMIATEVAVQSAGPSYLSEYRLGDQFADKFAGQSTEPSTDQSADDDDSDDETETPEPMEDAIENENTDDIEEALDNVKVEAKEEPGAEESQEAPPPEQSDQCAEPVPKRIKTTILEEILRRDLVEPGGELGSVTDAMPLEDLNVKLKPECSGVAGSGEVAGSSKMPVGGTAAPKKED